MSDTRARGRSGRPKNSDKGKSLAESRPMDVDTGAGSNEYGLRRRNGAASPAGGPSSDRSAAGTPAPGSIRPELRIRMKQLEKLGINKLSKNEIKSDLMTMRGLLPASTPKSTRIFAEEGDMRESGMDAGPPDGTTPPVPTPTVPAAASTPIKSATPTSSKASKSGSKSGKLAKKPPVVEQPKPAQIVTNYRVPFLGKLKAKRRAEEYFSVNEREYQSVRHAYIKQLRALDHQKQHHTLVLDQLRKEVVREASHVMQTNEVVPLLQQAASSLFRANVDRTALASRVAELEAQLKSRGPTDKDNDTAMASLDTKEVVVDTIESKVGNTVKKESNGRGVKGMQVDTSAIVRVGAAGGRGTPMSTFPHAQSPASVVHDEDEAVRRRIGSKSIQTVYGPGRIVCIRADGMIKVKLTYGIAFMGPECAFPQAEKAQPFTLKQQQQHLLQQQQNNKRKKAVAIWTPVTLGAPRGVQIDLSPLSNEADFSVPRQHEPDGLAMHMAFKNQRGGGKRSAGMMSEIAAISPAYSDAYFGKEGIPDMERNDRAALWDGPSPLCWGGPWSTPWHAVMDRLDDNEEDDVSFVSNLNVAKGTPSSEGHHQPPTKRLKFLCRDEISKWEEERFEFLQVRAEAIRMANRLHILRQSVKRKDKILSANVKTQDILVRRLGAARSELATLRVRYSHLMKASPSERVAVDAQETNVADAQALLEATAAAAMLSTAGVGATATTSATVTGVAAVRGRLSNGRGAIGVKRKATTRGRSAKQRVLDQDGDEDSASKADSQLESDDDDDDDDEDDDEENEERAEEGDDDDDDDDDEVKEEEEEEGSVAGGRRVGGRTRGASTVSVSNGQDGDANNSTAASSGRRASGRRR